MHTIQKEVQAILAFCYNECYIRKLNEYLTCTGELGNLGSTQVEVVGAGHNPLNKSPLELRHQNRTQLISAAL